MAKKYGRTKPRPRIVYPQWDGEFRGYAINYINKAKTASVLLTSPNYDFNDLLQEAAVCFYKVGDVYPDVFEPPHYMALFKTTLHNHFIDLTTALISSPEQLMVDTEEFDDNILAIVERRLAPSFDHYGELVQLLSNIPPHIAAFIDALINTQPGTRVYGKDRRYHANYFQRESTRAKLNRLVGREPDDGNPREEIRAFLEGLT